MIIIIVCTMYVHMGGEGHTQRPFHFYQNKGIGDAGSTADFRML